MATKHHLTEFTNHMKLGHFDACCDTNFPPQTGNQSCVNGRFGSTGELGFQAQGVRTVPVAQVVLEGGALDTAQRSTRNT